MNDLPARQVLDEPARASLPALSPPVQVKLHRRKTVAWQAVENVGAAALIIAFLWAVGDKTGASGYTWDFGVLQDYRELLVRGLLVTLGLSAASIVTSMAVGILVWACRVSPIAFVRWLTTAYIEVMRTTPLLIQLVWVFYALPIVTGITLPGLTTALLALTLHGAAYYAEAYRAGIQAVPREQKEAADVLGLGPVLKLRIVVLPQAFRNVIPVLVTQSLVMVKDTSLVTVLGISDLFSAGSTAALTTFRPIEVFTVVGIVYFLIGFPITLVIRRLEMRLDKQTS